VASAELADLCGVVNAAHGRMIEVVADVLADDAWVISGILSPRHWLTWQTAMTDASASAVVHLATRRDDLAATVAATVEGRLSLALAGLIARYVPTEFEADALDLAAVLTVNQMRRVVTRYRFDVEAPEATPGSGAGESTAQTQGAGSPPTCADGGPVDSHPDPAPTDGGSDSSDSSRSSDHSDDSGAVGSGTDGSGTCSRPSGADGDVAPPHRFGRVTPIEERREVSMGIDDGHWYCTIRLPIDEGTLFETGVRNRRDDLYRDAKAATSPGDPKPRVSLADAIVSMAHTVLEAGAAATPSTDRYMIHAHLTAAPAGGNNLTHHLSAVLPDHLRRLHTCDGTIRPVLEREGTPCNVGRSEHIVPRRLRRLIEQRDGGCTVPGCDRRTALQVHHIVHWENEGPTDTDNLITLCRGHHRAHHLGHLQIVGNADLPRHTAPGVCFADRWGRQLLPAATPTRLGSDQSVAARAQQLRLDPQGFRHPIGERMDPGAITFNRRAS
jgi:hypothetical protein